MGIPSQKKQVSLYVLMDLGSINSARSGRCFLKNMFNDTAILPLPYFLRKIISTLIIKKRLPVLVKNYQHLPQGSPLYKQIHTLQNQLRKALPHLFIRTCFRYTPPFPRHLLPDIRKKNVQRIILLPLFPFFSYTTTQSSINIWKKTLLKKNISLEVIPPFYDHPLFLAAWQEQIQTILKKNHLQNSDCHFILSFHSLPLSLVKKRKDPYPEQIQTFFEHLKQKLDTSACSLAYQSSSSGKWLGPSVKETLKTLSEQKTKKTVVLIPLSFCAENGETLFELDHLYANYAKKIGLSFLRVPIPVETPLWQNLFETLMTTHLDASKNT